MDALVAKKGPFRWEATSVLKGYLGILHASSFKAPSSTQLNAVAMHRAI